MIEVVKPRKPGFDIPAEDFMLNFLDNYYYHFPLHLKILFPMGLYLFEYGAIFMSGRFRPFSWLSAADREKYTHSWVYSRVSLFRDLIKGVKGICLTGFYSHPQAMAHIDYDLPGHIERVSGGAPCDEEACRYFRELGYDNVSPIPYPARDGEGKG